MYSDYRTLRAPLPGMGVGAVVEEAFSITDERLYFEGGSTYRFYLGANVPTRASRVVIEAPASLPLQHRMRGDGPRPKVERRKNQVRITYAAGSLPAREAAESWLPAEVVRYPHVSLSTGRSWSAVAEAYAAVVERQLAAGPIEAGALPASLPEARGPRIDAVLAALQARVRYSGLELGEASIVPWTPRETLSRAYGDCKDKASLLVAMLRAAGVPARVALLRVGPGPEVNPSAPGLGGFNHAIVYVPGPRALWIDPTDELSRAGELPLGDQGRLALVAGEGTRRLVRTPRAPAADNTVVELRDIYLPARGDARVVETVRPRGVFANYYRGYYRDGDPDEVRKQLRDYVEREYLAATLARFDTGRPAELERPYELQMEAEGSERGSSDGALAHAYLPTGAVFRELPDLLRKASKDDAEPRVGEVMFMPYRYELRYRVHLPPGFRVTELPEARTESLGPAVLTVSAKTHADTVTVTARFDTGDARYTPAQAAAMRDAVVAHLDGDAMVVRAEQVAMAHVHAGRTAAGLAALDELAAAHPRQALYLVQRAEALLGVGLGAEAAAVARRAVELEPRSAYAQWMLGRVLEHDRYGRQFGAGFDRAGALAALRRAVALDGDDPVAGLELAWCSRTMRAGFATPATWTPPPRPTARWERCSRSSSPPSCSRWCC